jgi:hypothetical protein
MSDQKGKLADIYFSGFLVYSFFEIGISNVKTSMDPA